MESCNINRINLSPSSLAIEAPSGPIAPISEQSLPLARRERISGIWNKTVAFFTQGYIGKAIASKTYLATRETIGEISGRCLLGSIGASFGRYLGQHSSPAFAAAMYAALVNSSAHDKLGISKTALATGIAATAIAMQTLFGEYFEDSGSAIGEYVFGSIGAFVGNIVLSYITSPPDVPFKEHAKKYLSYTGMTTLAGAILPSFGIVDIARDKLAFLFLYNREAIIKVYEKASLLLEGLKEQDIGQFTQTELAKSSKPSSWINSLFFGQISRFIRVGMRSLNKYSALTQCSSKIQEAQTTLREAFHSSDETAIERAKKNLLLVIKKEMKQQFALVGVANGITSAAFDRFLSSKLDAINIVHMEEFLLGFAITDETNEAYSQALLQIHAKCFLAFAVVHFTHKSPLSKDEQLLFFDNIAHIFMSHYKRVAPDSAVVQYIDSALQLAVDYSARTVLSVPSNTILEEVPSMTSTEMTEEQAGRFKFALLFVISIVVAIYRYLVALFSSESSPSEETITQIITETATEVFSLVAHSDSLESEEEPAEEFFDAFEDLPDIDEGVNVITGRITEIANDDEVEFFDALST